MTAAGLPPIEAAKRSAAAWSADKAPRLAAALAYAALFAIAPLLIIAVEAAAIILGAGHAGGHHGEVRSQVFGEVGRIAGAGTAAALQQIVDGTLAQRKGGVLAQTVGWALLAFGATGLFSAVQDALNTVWGVSAPRSGGWAATIRDRAATFLMIVVVAAILLASVVANAAIAVLSKPLAAQTPFFGVIAQGVDFIVTTGIVFVLFAAIFKFLPDTHVAWRHVWSGALISAVLFMIGQLALSWYLGRASVASAYGAAGSLVVLLLWLNYSAQIFLFGAEYTKVAANADGAHLGGEHESAETKAARSPGPVPATS